MALGPREGPRLHPNLLAAGVYIHPRARRPIGFSPSHVGAVEDRHRWDPL